MFEPSDIAQEALDAALLDLTVSDLEEGSSHAQLLARKYRPCLTSLLRAAHWGFARKQIPMVLLGDITGQLTQSTLVIPPWVYEYALPNDCVQARFVPYGPPANTQVPDGNIAISTTTPITTGAGVSQTAMYGSALRPARFLITRDSNYPPDDGSNWMDVQGQSPGGQTVVLTDVPYASLVYTSLVLYPSEWDSLFREAMVAYLASEICVLHKDKKFAFQIRNTQIAIAKTKIIEARVADGNEGQHSIDHIAEWTRARASRGYGYGGGGFGAGQGCYGMGYGPVGFADGNVY